MACRPETRMLPRSNELLLQFLHRDPALPAAAQLALLSAADWNALVADAIRCQIAAQVRDRIRAEPGREAVAPPDCLDRLNDSVRITLMRNMHQQVQLRRMAAACQAADLPVMLLKGLWLAEIVYRDLSARPSTDIDLLLRPADMPRFTRLALQMGFNVPAEASNICDLRPGGNEFPLIHAAERSYFDIHWAMTLAPDEALIDEEQMWRRSEMFAVAGTSCRSLGPEDHLLYVCFHAADHHRFLYVGPRALLDVATLVSTPPRPIDWAAVVSRARELRWARGVWLMLDLARLHLGAPVPSSALAALEPADPPDEALRGAVLDALFLDMRHKQGLPMNVVRLFEQNSLRRRTALLLTRLFPPRQHVAAYFKIGVGTRRMFWLYARRWGMLLRHDLPKVGRLVTGDRRRNDELERTRRINRWFGKRDP